MGPGPSHEHPGYHSCWSLLCHESGEIVNDESGAVDENHCSMLLSAQITVTVRDNSVVTELAAYCKLIPIETSSAGNPVAAA